MRRFSASSNRLPRWWGGPRCWRFGTGTVAGRVIELTPRDTIDKLTTYDEYIHNEQIREHRAEMYK